MTMLYFLLPYGNICSLIRLFYKMSYIFMFRKVVRMCAFTRIRPLLPTPITPETLPSGHDLVTLDILPNHSVDVDPDWNPTNDKLTHIRNIHEKLNENRKKLSDICQHQGYYVSVKHDKGDLVLLFI